MRCTSDLPTSPSLTSFVPESLVQHRESKREALFSASRPLSSARIDGSAARPSHASRPAGQALRGPELSRDSTSSRERHAAHCERGLCERMGHLGRRALDVGDAAWLDTSAGPWTVRVSLRVRSASLLTTARRWGATSVLLSPSEGGGPTWLVLSGKTFVAGETSDSSPTSPTSLYLSLDDPALNLSSPNWRSFESPATIYASAAPLDDSRALLFGGDATGDPAFPTQTTSDSSFVLDVLPAFITSSMVTRWGHPSSLWGGQPARRESAFMLSATNGTVTKVWMYGGRRSDGSGTMLDELWELTIDLSSRGSALSSPSEGWRSLSTSGSWPGAMSEGTAVLLTSPAGEAELWLFGGVQIDAQGIPQLVPLDTIHIYTPSTSSWSTVAVTNPPAARRDHVAVALAGGVWIQGGRNLDGSTVFGDGALLSFSGLARGSWTATASGGGARWGHVAQNVGGTAVLAFGTSPLPSKSRNDAGADESSRVSGQRSRGE